MKSKKEIKKQKQEDVQFIISAVTTELYSLARLKYFGAWEDNGGMQWFFSECVNITHEIMFTEGSAYLTWLNHWAETPNGERCEDFSEITDTTCFDWHHMIEAKKLFESRYTKDECTKVEISEHIGHLVNSFETTEDRIELMEMSVKFAKSEREVQKQKVDKQKVQAVIDSLKAMEVDGETMEHIISEVGMTEQMVKQLYLDKN